MANMDSEFEALGTKWKQAARSDTKPGTEKTMEPRRPSKRRTSSIRTIGIDSQAAEGYAPKTNSEDLIEFTIPGSLPGENEIIAFNRAYYLAKRNKRFYIYNKFKKDLERKVVMSAISCRVKRLEPLDRFNAFFHWVEKNNRRDPDNIAAGVKWIFDALVNWGVIAGDRRKNVVSISHTYETDKKKPRIIVRLVKSYK